MNRHETTYATMLQHILDNGRIRPDRTGTGTFGVFGYQNRYDLSDGEFPLLTTKKMDGVSWKNIVVELLWFLRGDTNIRYLLEHGVHIWTDWPIKRYNAHRSDADKLDRDTFERLILTNPDFARQWGDCGPIYGKQWRAWTSPRHPDVLHTVGSAPTINYGTVDQIQEVFNELAANPFSRRHIVNSWNSGEIGEMVWSGLPPCHCLFQFNVREMTVDERWALASKLKPKHMMFDARDTIQDVVAKLDQFDIPRYYLDCHLYQRSADVFLGVPYNIASYALLVMIFAQQLNYHPGELVHSFGDLHIYANHMEQVKEQLSRSHFEAPQVQIDAAPTLFDYQPDNFHLLNYQSHPALRAPVAV